MIKHTAGLLVLLSAFSALSANSQELNEQPAVDGYITRAVSPTDFDVNGYHIRFDKKTIFWFEKTEHIGGPEVVIEPLFLGETVKVFGTIDRGRRLIHATQIEFCAAVTHPISGTGIIDRVLSRTGAKEILVRADGYPIKISADTKVTFNSPLTSLSDVTTNIWVSYHGELQLNGVVVAKSVDLTPNVIRNSEAKLLDKNDYDPQKVDPSSEQSDISKFFRGLDPKQIPPYKDVAMQARVDRIGAKLIPAYQRELPESDLTKLLFHFQLIDTDDLRDAWTLPTGIILVPKQLVERMQNDSQLATMLADNIACALEKQRYRMQHTDKKLTAAQIASLAGLPWGVDVLSTTSLVKFGVDASMRRNALDQSGRVSLDLLSDAGYDITEAPKTWWLLSVKPPKSLANTLPPDRAMNLYRSFGRIWPTYSASAAAPSSNPPPSTVDNSQSAPAIGQQLLK